MRRGFSPTKSKVISEVTSRREQDQSRRTNPSVNYWKYFCHYNNAIYQGGMSAYKKHGKGVLLHDDGAAVITEYLHDTPNGHNIIFRQNSITSVLVKNSAEYEIAYKVGKCIIKVPFSENSQRPHGIGMLIDYQNFKIYQLIYKKGIIVEKILHLNKKNNDDAFKRNTIAKLIGLKHEQAFDLSFEKAETMHVKQDRNELTIGYCDEDGELHGLAFKMYAENVGISGLKSLYIKSTQRGYYRKSVLQTFGEKYFSNGNKYIGEFHQGQFHGHGILLCPQQMKWVYGKFLDGKLSEVLDSNNKRYTENDFQMWSEGLLDIHKRYRERWIDVSIELPEELFLYNTLKEAVKKPVTEVDPDYEQALKEDQYRMTKIQQQFLEGYPGDAERSYVDFELDKHYTVRSNKNAKPFDSTPRSTNKMEVQLSKKPYQNPKLRIQTPVSRIQTPVNRTEQKYASNTPTNIGSSKREQSQQKQYRMKDPFQFELIKVPFDQKPFRQKEKTVEYPNQKYPSISNTSKYPKERRQLEDRPFSPYRTSYNYRNSPSLLDRDIQHQAYVRSGISQSPVHRYFYNTPPRYDPIQGRYNGKIINKKNFNYLDPPNHSPERFASRRYQTTKEENDRANPKKEDLTGNYSPYRKSPRNKESPTGKNYIENNYKYWK